MSKLGIGDKLQQVVDQDDAYSSFKYFEPWDVEPRAASVIELAKADDVDLFNDDYISTGNIAPHPFQSGFLHSTKPIRVLIGPTQGGKSVNDLIEIGIMCSGEFPISLQYDKGVDSGVERMVTDLNVRRWGRFDKETGEFLDHDLDVERDGTWNCGNIIGAGKYPREKVIPKRVVEENVERTIWVGCPKKALDESWWPKLTKGESFPDKFIDRTKGNNGTNQSDGQHIVHLINGIRLSFITYESGFGSFEAVTVWACFFDEESKDEKCVAASLSHCKYFATSMTPYNGMTYTRDLFFKPKPTIDLFHATAYDSPYLTDEKIELLRSMYPEHEIKARIWGEHTAESKMPYYRQDKLRRWIKNIKAERIEPLRCLFVPTEDWFGIKKAAHSSLPGLIDVDVKLMPVDPDEGGDGKDDRGHNIAWTIYEDLRENCAYMIESDQANGADLPEDASDCQSAVVMRPPMLKGELYPVVVAEIESSVTPDIYAKMIAHALVYYNMALLCAEAPSRGAANGMFYSELRHYPHWYMRSVQKKSTRNYVTQQGIDTNTGTRKMFFDEVEKVFNSFTLEEMPPIPSLNILVQAQECQRVVKNGRIRPDHPRNKTNDLLMVYGIGLWIWKNFPEQVKCRRKSEEKLDIAPRDSVISLLERARSRETISSPGFPSNKNGARR